MDQGKSFNTLLAAFFATFVIGFGMGFSFHFALSKSPGQHSYAPDVPVATAVAPVAQPEPADEPEPELDPKPEFIEEPVESGIWPGRHLFIAVNGQWLSDASRELLREVKPGGVVLRSSNLGSVRQTLGFVREIKESVTPDDPSFSALPLIAVSHEGGDRNELGLANAPGASDLGAARDTGVARDVGVDLAAEAADRGVNVVFGPVLDIYDPASYYPSLATRSFGGDGELVAAMGLAVADGMMEGGVIPVVKHFPGYGSVSRNPNTGYAVMDGDTASLAIAMFPFDEAVNKGIPGVLVGHTAIPGFNDEDEGIEVERPASLSPMVVNGILREILEYDGVLIADDLSSDRVIRERGIAEAAVEALVAGCDALILLDTDPHLVAEVCRAIEAAAESGELSRKQLDRSKARLDDWRKWLDEPSGLAGPLPQLKTPVAVASNEPPAQSDPFAFTPTTVQEIPIGDSARSVGGFDAVAMARTGIEAVVFDTPSNEIGPVDEPLATTESSAVAESVDEEATNSDETLEPLKSPSEAGDNVARETEDPAQVDPAPEDPGIKGLAPLEGTPSDDSEGGADLPEPEPSTGAREFENTGELDQPVTEPMSKEVAAAEPDVESGSPEASVGGADGQAEVSGEEFDAPELSTAEPGIVVETDVSQLELVGEESDGGGDATEEDAVSDPSTEERTGDTQEVVPTVDGATESGGEPVTAEEAAVPDMVATPDSTVEDSAPDPSDAEAEELIALTYTVKEGESAADGAQAYAVSPESIRDWNELEGDALEAGTVLEIRMAPLPALVAGMPETSNPAGEAASKETATTDPPEQGALIHTVTKDETLTSISARYEVGVVDIQIWNGMTGTGLQIDRKLTIFPGGSASAQAKAAMPKTTTYRVQRGDGLAKVAEKYGTTVRVLQDLNNLSNPNRIVRGQRLKVPVKWR